MKFVRALIVVLPVVFFLYCAWTYFAIDGQWSVDTELSQDTHIISQLYPVGRALSAVEEKGEWKQDIVNEPVYLNVHAPQAFDRAEISVTLDPSTQPLISVGVVTQTNPLTTQLQLMQSSVVEKALQTFHRSTDNAVTILSRDEHLSTLDALEHSSARIATSGVTLSDPEVPSCATDSSHAFMLPGDIVGDHEIAFALKSETEQHITLASRTDTTATITLEDASKKAIGTATQRSGIYTLTIPASTMPTVYYVHIQGAGTTAFAAVTFPTDCIASQRFTFGEAQQPFTLFHTGKRMTLTATQNNAFGSYVVGDQTLTLDTIGAPKVAYTTESSSLSITQGNVTVANNGFISFASSTDFDPRGHILPLDETTTIDDIDALVLSTLPHVTQENNHAIYTSTVDLTHIAGTRTSLQFLLAAPGIAAHSVTVPVYHIHIDFYKEPLWTRIWSKVKHL